MEYVNRTYRERLGGERWKPFTVTVKETDLWIGVDRGSFQAEMATFAERFVRQLREEMEEYLAGDPGYAAALRPYRPEDSAPLLLRQMAEAARQAGIGPMSAVAGAIVFSFRGKIAASSTLESEDRKDRLFAFNVVYGVAYTFLTLYFLAGAFYMASYSRIDPSTAFPLIVVFLSIVSLYASMFIVVPKWNKKAANIVFASHLGANLLLTILMIVSFVLFPNALVDGYPALVPLELMGSLFVLPYALPVLLLLNSCLFYFLVCRKDKPAKGEKEER